MLDRQRSRGLPISTLLLAVLGAIASLARLVSSRSSAISDVLWAEDGMHALCARNQGVMRCLIEPYAGFAHVVPRLFGGVVAFFPIEHWPLIANILSAVLAGLIAAMLFVIARVARLSLDVSIGLAAIAIAHPILGIESTNSYSNGYIPLLLLGATAIALPAGLNKAPAVLVAGAGFLMVSTLPVASLLALPLLLQWYRRSLSRRRATWALCGLAAGSVLQLVAMLGSHDARALAFERARLVGWIRIAPSAVTSVIPSLVFSNVRVFEESPALGDFGEAVLALILVACALVFVTRVDALQRGAGILLFTGVGSSLVTSVLLGPTTRYMTWLALTSTAAGALLIEGRVRLARRHTRIVAWVAVGLLWWAAWPASSYRAATGFSWSQELRDIQAACNQPMVEGVRVPFAPNWPSGEIELHGLDRNVISCASLAG